MKKQVLIVEDEQDVNVKKHNPEDAEEVLLFTATLAGLILVTILWQ